MLDLPGDEWLGAGKSVLREIVMKRFSEQGRLLPHWCLSASEIPLRLDEVG